ncbi:MAG TPA: inner membrane CreD family protein, partial [Bacteroidota bacterium]|nr:inner membrane CreD family protein [Bacteroidota bacterium]
MNDSMLKNSVILRMIIIAGLTLLLLAPTLFIQLLISDRESTRDSAIAEVSQSWGGNQTITGPVLTVPYKELVQSSKDIPTYTVNYIHFLPSKLLVRSTLKPEVRYRGIYEVGLYNARVMQEGEFPPLVIDKFGIDPANIQWHDAFMTIGISDLKGIRDTVNFRFNQSSFSSEPGV